MRLVAVIGITCLCGAGSLTAQAFGIPVPGLGIRRGTTLHAMAAFPNGAAEGGVAVMAGVSLGARRVGVLGFGSRRLDRSGPADGFWSGGALVNLKVFGGPLVPFSVMLQGGAAYASEGNGGAGFGITRWHVPAGLAISWLFARPGVSVTPWVAPRLDHVSSTGPDPLGDPPPGGTVPRSTTTVTEFGLSGGLSFGFLSGFTLEVAYDRVLGGGSPATVGLGITFPL
jgi:hypothetical protein